MRIMHVPFSFFPSVAGGTEVYVQTLARELKSLGIDSVVVAPGASRESYQWDNQPVFRFPGSSGLSLPAQHGAGDPVAAQEFGKILDETKPDLVHFHALTASASGLAMTEARRRNLPVLLTYHTPTVSCVRGSMMKWGSEPCDGRMRSQLCTACCLHGKGMARTTATALSWLPAGMLDWIGRQLQPGRLATALRLPALVRLRHSATRQAFALCDAVVAVCEWVSAVLRVNAVPMGKVCVSRQGVALGTALQTSISRESQQVLARPLRLAYFGRIEQVKGVHVLAAALALDKGLPVTLDVFGIRGDESLWQQLAAQALEDSRLGLHDAVAADTVVTAMQKHDLVVVPSQWLETGPLVVYEAMAAGVPVLGSDLGGIAEIVTHDVTGFLVEANDPGAWLVALRSIIDHPEMLARWRQQLTPPRTMHDVAIDMAQLYTRQLSGQSQRGGMKNEPVSRRIIYVQYTNPAGYPPLEHSSHLLAEAGWEVLFLGIAAAGGTVLEFAPHRNITVRRLEACAPGLKQKLHYLRFLLWCWWQVMHFRPAWVYASDVLSTPVALLLSMLPNIRLLYHEHDAPGDEQRGWFASQVKRCRRAVAGRADIVVIPNEGRAAHFAAQCGIDPARILCVWNCPQRSEALPTRPSPADAEDFWL
ncbi:MAG: glycosyltransferase, partial [Pseudomonadota bacterium]